MRLYVLVWAFGLACLMNHAHGDASHALWTWSFNEGKGKIVRSAIDQAAGRVIGEPRWVEAPDGKALAFDGMSSYVKLDGGNAFHVAPDQGLTLEATVRVVKSGQTQMIVFSPPTLELEVRGENGAVSFNLVDQKGRSARCTGKTSITDGRWHDIVAVRDPRRGELRLYVDGHLDQHVEDITQGETLVIPHGAFLGGKDGGREVLGGAIDHLAMTRHVKTVAPREVKNADVAVKTWVLQNERLALSFVARGSLLTLDSLVDRKTGTEFIESEAEKVNLWQVHMRSARFPAILDETQGELSVEQTDTQMIFTWSNLPLDQNKATVTMTVDLPADAAMSSWKIDVAHDSEDFGVWTVHCPRLMNLRKLADAPADNFVAIPGGNGGGAGEGQLFHDPWQTMHAFVRTYPCYHQSMQFNAWYGPDSGLYLATYDGEMHLKGFHLKPTTTRSGKPIMTYDLLHYPADSGVEGTLFQQAYPALVGTFQGDWYDAARIYRKWALDQVWCRLGPTHQREDISPWIKNGAYWMVMPLDRSDDDRPFLRRKARELPYDEVQRLARHVDVEKSVAKVERAYEYFGFPMLLWSNEWFDGGGDYSPPRYVPLNNLEKFLTELHRRVPESYFSGHIQPKRYSIQVAEYNKEVEASLEHTPDGHLAIEPPDPRETYDEHAYPCWATEFWQEDWRKRSADRAALGLDGYHVDELGSATTFEHQCFNRDHGHPIGGGTLYAETRRNMLNIIRESARTQRPHFAAHHEVLCEIYIDIADAAEVCTAPNNLNVPIYEAVYHDYNFIMGRRIIEWMDRNLYPLGDRDGDELIDEFVSSYAQTYIWGNQPGWTRIDIPEYAPRVAAFIKRSMEARYRAMGYLNFGDMMRPLVLTKPLEKVKRIWRMTDTPEHHLPVVMNSVWKAPDGTVGIVLFNITDEPQTIAYRCDLAECGLMGRRFTLTRIDGPQPKAMGEVDTALLERADTIAPYDVMILKVESKAE